MEADELGPRQQGCHTDYRITTYRYRTECEGCHQVLTHEQGLRRRKRTHTDLLIGLKRERSERSYIVFTKEGNMSVLKNVRDPCLIMGNSAKTTFTVYSVSKCLFYEPS